MKQRQEEIFSNVNFISQEDFLLKEQNMRQQIRQQVQKLNWLQNSQNVLTQLLRQKKLKLSSQIIYNEQSDIFISSRKKIFIPEIYSFFRNYNQLFQQNLQSHKVEVEIKPQLLNKPKFHQAFIYHLKTFDNSQSTTSLQATLEPHSVCENLKTDTICNGRIQNQNEQLQSFTIRKFRQEDIKVLKFITGPCKRLKSLHVDFFNKSDLSHNKDLIEYLEQKKQKDLSQFFIKIRTQSQVKRLYGYLVNFNMQASNLSQTQVITLLSCSSPSPNSRSDH